jgi:hypothetical protein
MSLGSASASPVLPQRSATVGAPFAFKGGRKEARLTILWIIVVVVLVLALLGFLGFR